MDEWPPGLARDSTAPLEETPVLVAVMNNLRDFCIAREDQWYRIPVKHVPRRLGAEHIAFYQTQPFGDERWSVNYYAPIRRIHLMQRQVLLPDEPDHPRAQDWYYKVEIEPLQRLPHSIPSRRLRRITFIATTLSRLLAAWEINDLWLGTEEEERLWEAFKQNAISVERRMSLRETEDDHDGGARGWDESYLMDFVAPCHRGNVGILCVRSNPPGAGTALRETPSFDYECATPEWTILRFSPQQVAESLAACVAAVTETIEQHGGLQRHWQS